MTREQAKNMLKAKLECLKRETSGFYGDCNRCNCDECSLNYEQGNMGEQKLALDIAIKALEQEPCENATPKDIFCMGCEYKEQEPILDKIRAEIEQEYKVESEHPYGQGLRRALQIIDKHKAESEG